MLQVYTIAKFTPLLQNVTNRKQNFALYPHLFGKWKKQKFCCCTKMQILYQTNVFDSFSNKWDFFIKGVLSDDPTNSISHLK